MQLSLVNVLLASIAAVGVLPGASALPYELAHKRNVRVPRAASNGKVFVRTHDNSTSTIDSTTTSTTSLETETATSTYSLDSTSTDTSLAVETTVYSGSTPIDSAALPSITDWSSCESFLNSEGINLFSNSFNNFDVVIEEVTVFQILIDERGRARETRTFHSFPQPTNYFEEFDLTIQANINIEEVNSIDSNSFFDNSGFESNSFSGGHEHDSGSSSSGSDIVSAVLGSLSG